MANQRIDPNLLLLGGLAVGAYVFGRKLLQAFNLVPDAADAAESNFEKASYWSPQYAATGPDGTALLTAAKGQELSRKIRNAFSYINDDEDAVYGVFGQLKTKSQVSSLAYWFNRYQGKDLYNFIAGFLSQSELLKVKTIIDKLPNYKVGGINGIGTAPKNSEKLFAVVATPAGSTQRVVLTQSGSRRTVNEAVKRYTSQRDLFHKAKYQNVRVKQLY